MDLSPGSWMAPLKARAGEIRSRMLCCAVLVEPIEHPAPGIFGIGCVIARPIVGIETVLRVWINDDLGWAAGGFQGLAHRFHLFERNAGVLAAVESKHRKFQRAGDIERGLGAKFGRGVEKLSIPRC